jgi:hypothetical protein
MPYAAALFAIALVQTSPDATTPASPPPVAPLPPMPMQAVEPVAPMPSLLSAEPLERASLLSFSGGWPRVRGAYAQGVSPRTDLGGFVDYDYSTTELRAGLSYRGQVIPRAPPFEGALRAWLAWYDNFGGDWLYHSNHPDEGLEIGAGLSYSRRGGGGVVSVLADLPLTITFRKGGGAFLNPRATAAYELPAFGAVTVGTQLGLGARFGVGNAPLRKGMAEVTILALASYRLR